MSLVLTPIVTDNFTPDANPLNPANWTVFTGISALKAVSGKCLATVVFIAAEYYSGHGAFPNDQYITATLTNTIPAGSASAFNLVLRSTVDGAAGYFFTFTESGVSGKLNIAVTNNTITLPIASGRSYSPGDTFTVAAVGTDLYVLQNGTQIGTVTDSSETSGVLGLVLEANGALTNVQLSTFIAGSAASTSTSETIPNSVCRPAMIYGRAPNGVLSAVTTDGNGNIDLSGQAASFVDTIGNGIPVAVMVYGRAPSGVLQAVQTDGDGHLI